MMSYPIPPTYYIMMDLWQYFGMVSEFPEITGLLRFYPLSVIKLAKRYFYSMKHLFICKILLVKSWECDCCGRATPTGSPLLDPEPPAIL